jgi:predicted O-methyltransferase YrrM
MIELNKEELAALDMSYAKDLAFKGQENFDAEPGKEAYRLYAYLSKTFNYKTILDVGTRFGNSALSLSKNGRNKVVSYNITEEGASQISKKNITWKIMDFRNDDTIEWEKVSLILLDVDPHDGKKEREMLDFLAEKNWSGIILLDDIHLNGQMKDFWNKLPEEKKQDVTEFGHASGTGILEFNKQ